MPADIETTKIQRVLAAMMQKLDEIETHTRETLEKVIELEVQMEDSSNSEMSEFTLNGSDSEEEEGEIIRDVDVTVSFTNG